MEIAFRIASGSWPNTKFDMACGPEVVTSIQSHLRKSAAHFTGPLNAYLKGAGKATAIDGGILQQQWFPMLDFDVFISHSHKDKHEAYIIARDLTEKMGLKVFVDSIYWGFADDLIANLGKTPRSTTQPNRYVNKLKPPKEASSEAHVYLMLASAIAKVVHQTKCLLFIESNHSVNSAGNEPTTSSPWINYELFLTTILRRPDTVTGEAKVIMENFSAIDYPLDFSKLPELTTEVVSAWLPSLSSAAKISDPAETLGRLYTEFQKNVQSKL